jgi:hypothetical protein
MAADLLHDCLRNSKILRLAPDSALLKADAGLNSCPEVPEIRLWQLTIGALRKEAPLLPEQKISSRAGDAH